MILSLQVPYYGYTTGIICDHEEGSDLSSSISSQKKTRIIVITSGKGGVGKSTVTTNFGLSLAKLGYKIAVIDADIGLRNLDLFLGLEHKIFFNVIDVLEGRCSFEKALLTDKRFPNLTFISLVRKKKKVSFYNSNNEKFT